jgi:hypothetical protein
MPQRYWRNVEPGSRPILCDMPEGAAIAQELLESVASWPMLRDVPKDLCSPDVSLSERLVMLSEQWEPDFVLLAPRRHTSPANSHHDELLFTVAGGCVCFPSAWRLTDKLGQTVDQVHQPVPQLNSTLAPQIDRLLARLRPGKCLVRSNWGVCRLPERNQHPERNLPAIQLPVRLEEAWLRREDQCLFALPRTGGIVFGIRVTHTFWPDVRRNRTVARSVARSLRTMPHAMLDYKRLADVREQLARLLDDDA